MKKIMKLLAAVCLAVCGLLLAPATTANAAEDVTIIYAQVPSDWANPCVWAWDADGNNAFEAWPGGAMVADSNNEGWYYIYVPSTMSSVIINANEGTVQTSDMATNSANCWVTVNSPEDATLTNDQLTAGDIPAYVAEFTIYAKVDESWKNPCLWAWSAPDGTNVYAAWPGEAMKENPDGWYTMKVPEWVNSIIVNANEGAVQTSDMTIEAKDVWVTVDAEGVAEFAYEQPAASVEDMITIYAQVPSDWLLPSLWAWSAPDGTNVFPNWPGQELTLDGDWYTYQVPNWVNSIIINGNLGTVQTSDISIDTGKDVWVVVKSADDVAFYYEEPSADAAPVEDTTEVAPADDTTEAEPAEVPAEESSEGISTTTIVIIIVVAVVVIAIIVVAVVTSKKKKK